MSKRKTATQDGEMQLTDDEELVIAGQRFRILIWRRLGEAPHVLVCQYKSMVPPDWYSTTIANRVLRWLLWWQAAPLPEFFEYGVWKDKTKCCRVDFSVIGAAQGLRPILVDPKYYQIPVEPVERLIESCG